MNDSKDVELEEYELYEEDYFKYNLHYECKIVEEDNLGGTILCGNELIYIGVREDNGIGDAEIEIVDYFLWRIECFNHSGKYKGIVMADDFFNDNRYGPVSVNIKYILPKGMERDISEEELRHLLDTEFKCNPMVVNEVRYESV